MTMIGWLRITRKIFVACLYVFWIVGPLGCGGDNNSWKDLIDEPNAWAGADQNVVTGTLVTLDGSGSNGDGDLFLNWSFVSLPTGSSAILSGATGVKPTFIADVDGVYIVQLLVISAGKSDTDTVTITAATANSAPVANAGPDQNVVTGTTVNLDGSASSDADGDNLSYTWTLSLKPSGSSATLSSSNVAKPTFMADLAGEYIWSLMVNDGYVSSTADSITVTATAPSANSVPVANAGPDQNTVTGDTVTLDGSASRDADRDPLSYSWTIIMPPPGSAAVLSGANTAFPTFIPDLSGTYLIRLVVNDGISESLADTVTVTATATFKFGAYYIQYRTYESGASPVYRYFLPMTKDDLAIEPTTDIVINGVSMFDSSNNVVSALSSGTNLETYMYLNCMAQPCVESGPLDENGFWGNLPNLPADTYKFVVETLDGQSLNLDVPFSGQLDLPIVSSNTMQSSLAGNDLVLNWTNPVGEPSWTEVDQLRIRLFDINGRPILYVRLDPTAEAVTINGSLLDQSAALVNDMMTTWEILASWEIQTRAYDGNNMNFSRGISNRVDFVAPVP